MDRRHLEPGARWGRRARALLTTDQVAKALRSGNQLCQHGLYTDQIGLAYFLDCSTRTLRNWRVENEGPKWSMSAGAPIYQLDDICEWLNKGGNSPRATKEVRPNLSEQALREKVAKATGLAPAHVPAEMVEAMRNLLKVKQLIKENRDEDGK